MAAASNPKITGQSQATRRTKYGLNVTIAALVAILLVVLINWMFETQVRRLPAGLHRLMRYDLTATRQYSLSDQTIKVLKNINEDYKLVTLIGTENPYTEQARDLADEYATYSPKVSIDHVNLMDYVALDKFYQALHDRHNEEVGSLAVVIGSGRQVLDNLENMTATQLEPLRELIEDPSLQDEQLKKFGQSVGNYFALFGSNIEAVQHKVTRSLDQPMPDYEGAKKTLESFMTELRDNLYAIAIEQFEKSAADDQTPSSIRERLLGLIHLFQQTKQQLDNTASDLGGADEALEYDKFRRRLLSTRDAVVLISAEQVRLIAVEDMYRTPDPSQTNQGQDVEPSFLGEELLTGALVSMSLDPPPMVVFVQGSRRPAIGPGGEYEAVAQRLRNMNLDVQQWSPSGIMSRMGPTPPGPPPEPQSGQKAAWIILPFDPVNPNDPMAGSNKQAVIEQISKRLAVGDGVLLTLSYDQTARFGQVDPFAQLLEPWDITAQIDRVVLREEVLPNQQTQASSQMDVSEWPEDSPITAALAGMRGVMVQASPLALGDGASKGVTLWPLVELRGRRLWAERNMLGIGNVQYDSTAAADSFVAAAAAEKNNQRLIVVATAMWANDAITTFGMFGRGTAQMFGAQFPANAELFVNCVYWLTSLDQLIAASARAQDIRRVESLTPGGIVALRWTLLAGLPLVIAIAGCGIWTVRRKD